MAEVGRVTASQFWGYDSDRDVDSNEDYGVGQLAVNGGRRQRQPLHPRVGLRPVTSSNGQTDISGKVFAMGALSQAGRLNLIYRVSGGRLLAARDVTLL